MRKPKWLGGSLNFQFTGIILVPPDGNSPPSGSKTSRPAGHQVMGTGSKNFASGSTGVIVSGIIPISTCKGKPTVFPYYVFLPFLSPLLLIQNTHF